MLILLKDILEEKGWKAAVNTEPKKAITQSLDLNPDCVIIDLHSQGINGLQVLDDLQNHTNQRFVPKIITSQINDRETRLNAYKLGADDFMVKPIDMEELMIRMERLLKRKKSYYQLVNLDKLASLEITKKTLFISVIDDDAIIRTMLMRILNIMVFDHCELNLEVFEDGLQFFASNRLEKPGEHFLILDGVMPVMDGIEILQIKSFLEII
jgi:DNA-binding response OmpR family regulator